MKKAINKRVRYPVAKKIFATVMMLLLLWITGINFLYLAKNTGSALVTCTAANGEEDSNDDAPNAPTTPDEKSPNAPISITEEYIHEYHNPVNPLWVDRLFEHKVHEAEKLCVVHTEYFSPPPDA